MKKPFVLIVGAGPVGLTLAIECHRHGVPFRIIDRNRAHSDKSKALAIWSGTLECLAAMGVVDEFLAKGLPLRHFRMADHGHLLNDIASGKNIDSPYPTPLILPQSSTEEILEQRLNQLGIKVEREVVLSSFCDQEESVSVVLTKADNSEESFEVNYLAACDGARSIVRHGLPVTFDGETESLGFVLIDAKIEGPIEEDAMFANWGAGYGVAFFPVKKGVFRMFTQRKDHTDKTPPTLEEMQGYLDITGLGHLRLYDPEWLSYFDVNERVASRNRVGHVFLLGDASHIHSPAGGQGMNTGMQDAFNLGWKLGVLAQGRGDHESIAESYFQERHPVAKALVDETTKLLHAGITSSLWGRVIKDFFVSVLLHLPLLQKLFTEKLSEMNIHYSQSVLIKNSHEAQASSSRDYQIGWRVYNASLVDPSTGNEISLWEKFLHSGHTLLLFSGEAPKELSSASLITSLRNFLSITNLTTFVRPVVIWNELTVPSSFASISCLDPKNKTHQKFKISEPTWLLVRPDLYVAAKGDFSAAGKKDIEEYLMFLR